eukprot:7389017-Prymnesium_polylepis.1
MGARARSSVTSAHPWRRRTERGGGIASLAGAPQGIVPGVQCAAAFQAAPRQERQGAIPADGRLQGCAGVTDDRAGRDSWRGTAAAHATHAHTHPLHVSRARRRTPPCRVAPLAARLRPFRARA